MDLCDLQKYPKWSNKRHLHIIEYRKSINDFTTLEPKLLYNLWRVKPSQCICGFITTNQNLQKHLKSKKHLSKLENKEKVEKVSCECGGKYTIKNKIQHCNKIKHLLFINKEG
jgi:hypothetical protein